MIASADVPLDETLLAQTQTESSSSVVLHAPETNDQADSLQAAEAISTPILESDMPGIGVDDGSFG
jgi:hypothetical protein